MEVFSNHLPRLKSCMWTWMKHPDTGDLIQKHYHTDNQFHGNENNRIYTKITIIAEKKVFMFKFYRNSQWKDQ